MLQPIPFALFFALVFAIGWRASGRRGFLLLSLGWLAYAVYEYLIYTRVLCTGDCNIRVDLLLIYPALLIGSVRLGWTAAVSRIRRKGRSGMQQKWRHRLPVKR